MRTFILSLVLLVIAVSCQPGTKGVWDSTTTLHLNRDGSIDVERVAGGRAEVVSPKNASTAPSMVMNESGITTVGSGEWQERAVDWVMQGTKIYYIASIVCAIAAVGVFWFFHQPVAAAFLGALAGVFMFAPSLIQRLGKPFAILVGVLVIGAAVAALATAIIRRIRHNKGADSFAALVKENRPAEAVAALRGANATVDNAFRKRKMKAGL